MYLLGKRFLLHYTSWLRATPQETGETLKAVEGVQRVAHRALVRVQTTSRTGCSA